MTSDMPDLTFLYIYFAKIFCQNKIKKNRSSSFDLPSKTVISGDMQDRVNLWYVLNVYGPGQYFVSLTEAVCVLQLFRLWIFNPYKSAYQMSAACLERCAHGLFRQSEYLS